MSTIELNYKENLMDVVDDIITGKSDAVVVDFHKYMKGKVGSMIDPSNSDEINIEEYKQ